MTDITELTSVQKNANIHRLSRLIAYAPNDELRQLAVEVEQYTEQLIEALEHYKSREERVISLVRDNSKSWDELYRQVEAKGKRNAELVEALEKARQQTTESENRVRKQNRHICELFDDNTALRQRIAELESRTVTAPQNDYFASLVVLARVSADKAMKKFPQPNYVLLKVAEEAGEVVQAGVHYAENRMEWKQVEGEIVQLLAMLIRLVTEGDQINGVTPPASCAAGIKAEAE